MATYRTCPATGCTRRIRVDRFTLACLEHWLTLPKPLHDDLWSTWLLGDLDAYAKAEARVMDFYDAKAGA